MYCSTVVHLTSGLVGDPWPRSGFWLRGPGRCRRTSLSQLSVARHHILQGFNSVWNFSYLSILGVERTHNRCAKRVVRPPREHSSASPSGIHLNSASTRQTLGAAIRGSEFTGGRDLVNQKGFHLYTLRVVTRCIQKQITGRKVLSTQVQSVLLWQLQKHALKPT